MRGDPPGSEFGRKCDSRKGRDKFVIAAVVDDSRGAAGRPLEHLVVRLVSAERYALVEVAGKPLPLAKPAVVPHVEGKPTARVPIGSAKIAEQGAGGKRKVRFGHHGCHAD